MRKNPPLTWPKKKYLKCFYILKKEPMLPNLETFYPFTELLVSEKKEKRVRS